MEIVGYICIGYVILRILGWGIDLFSPADEISVEELVKDVIDWCREIYPAKKKFPQVIISKSKSKYMGTYDFYSNTITIYLGHHIDWKGNVIRDSIISTTIHEYFHLYLQNSESKISRYIQTKSAWGDSGPHEWINEAMEEKLTPIYIEMRLKK